MVLRGRALMIGLVPLQKEGTRDRSLSACTSEIRPWKDNQEEGPHQEPDHAAP